MCTKVLAVQLIVSHSVLMSGSNPAVPTIEAKGQVSVDLEKFNLTELTPLLQVLMGAFD